MATCENRRSVNEHLIKLLTKNIKDIIALDSSSNKIAERLHELTNLLEVQLIIKADITIDKVNYTIDRHNIDADDKTTCVKNQAINNELIKYIEHEYLEICDIKQNLWMRGRDKLRNKLVELYEKRDERFEFKVGIIYDDIIECIKECTKLIEKS
jgi:hypothetical protein